MFSCRSDRVHPILAEKEESDGNSSQGQGGLSAGYQAKR